LHTLAKKQGMQLNKQTYLSPKSKSFLELSLKLEELTTAYQNLKKKIDSSHIPSHRKFDIRKSLSVIEAKIKELEKKEISVKKEGANIKQDVINELKENNDNVVVKLLEVGGNNRILSDTAASLITASQEELKRDITVLLFSVDLLKKNLIFVANVPQALVDKGLKANEWIQEIAKLTGGKGGGNPKVAQGNGPKIDNINETIKQAIMANLQIAYQMVF